MSLLKGMHRVRVGCLFIFGLRRPTPNGYGSTRTSGLLSLVPAGSVTFVRSTRSVMLRHGRRPSLDRRWARTHRDNCMI